MIHDLHESVALLLTWNGTSPVNEHIDPLTYTERLELSFHEVQTLTGFGMPGVWTWNFGDDLAHLYLDSIGHQPQRRWDADTRHTATAVPRPALRATDRPYGRAVEWYRPVPAPPGLVPLVGAR